jgi:nucleoside-diphosphate-sugar epimerase
VTEDSPANPQTARGRRRLDAENALRTWGLGHGVPVVILRVPGIYGPGRLPVTAIKERRPVVAEIESGFTNRIHSEDLADICVAAAERGRPDSIYNVSDGHPGTLAGYYNAVADALGLPRPPVISRDAAGQVLSAGMLSYLRESRRIDNRRMREELGVTLRYPTLEAGLKASIAAE